MIWPCEAVFAPRCDFSEKGGELSHEEGKRPLLQKSVKNGQGRKASRRKERGCGASPFPITTAGNADRIKVFRGWEGMVKKGS